MNCKLWWVPLTDFLHPRRVGSDRYGGDVVPDQTVPRETKRTRVAQRFLL